MMTTLLIENVKDEFLPAFKGLAKGINASCKTFVVEETKTSKKKTAKKAKEPEFYELEDMPIMKKLDKWAKANPKEHAQLVEEVEREMGLR